MNVFKEQFASGFTASLKKLEPSQAIAELRLMLAIANQVVPIFKRRLSGRIRYKSSLSTAIFTSVQIGASCGLDRRIKRIVCKTRSDQQNE